MIFDDTLSPSAPSYDSLFYWAFHPNRDDAKLLLPKNYSDTLFDYNPLVDVFYIHPTSYHSGDNWNASLEDSVVNFFLHIQGSGTISLENGKRIRVGYAGSNGRPYRSIAKWLDANGEMPLHKASMENIKSWVKNNPKRSDDMFNYNPRFIFFQEFPTSKDPSEGPRGTLGVPLTANHSIAVDEDFIKLGTPVMVIEEMQSKSNNAQSFFMMAQDTGSAIKGPNRGDLFFGTGFDAGRRAGSTKFRGTLIIFLPK